MASDSAGHTAESLTDCYQDRPWDTTMLEPLSLRVYFSGEPLESLTAGTKTDRSGQVAAR